MDPIAITAVGDPYQSMYSWRGAYPEIFEDFLRCFKAKELSLAYTVRHSQAIVDSYEKLYRRGLRSVKEDDANQIQILRGRGSIGEVQLLDKLVKPKDTVLARTNNQLRFVMQYARFSCALHRCRLLDEGESVVVKGQPPYVHLRTLNDAKGRTMENVFIIGAGSPFLPHFKSMNEEEEKHLLYVGMSRPKYNLYILYQDEPSKFLAPLMKYAGNDMKIRNG
jgi:superfamily I DNA/RNA helicase